MKTKVRRRSPLDAFRGHLLAIYFFAIVFGMFLGGITNVENSSEAESKRVLEESVHKAIISCYAIEGRYPESVEYLKENYNLIYDEEKYDIGYNIFADNIMPDVYIIDLTVDDEEETTETPPDEIPPENFENFENIG